MSAARVSVIVPVRDRSDLLGRLLTALDQQTFRDFQVIVVDDGSRDGSYQVAKEAVVAGKPVVALQAEGKGAVAARRIGAAASNADVLAFIDSDCTPSPKWLETGMRCIDSGSEMVNGLTRPERQPKPLERTMQSASEGLFPTCNIFFLRSSFERAGGLDDQAFRRLGFRVSKRAAGLGFGEDTILAWGLIRAGGRWEFCPDAVVEHSVFPPDLRETVSRSFQAGAFPALVREVPELRTTLLTRRYFLGTRHIPFYLFVLGSFTRRRGLIGAILAIWILCRINDHRSLEGKCAEKLRWLPAEMMLDVVAGSALIAGSIRARTVVL